MSDARKQILEENRANNNLSHQQVTFEFYKLLIENKMKLGEYKFDHTKILQAWKAANSFLSNYEKMQEAEVYGDDVSDAFHE